jgi:hypothetical protein
LCSIGKITRDEEDRQVYLLNKCRNDISQPPLYFCLACTEAQSKGEKGHDALIPGNDIEGRATVHQQIVPSMSCNLTGEEEHLDLQYELAIVPGTDFRWD